MTLAVVPVASGGLGVTTVTGGGLPVRNAAMGIAVTQMAAGGLPVVDVGGDLFGPPVIPANIGLPVIAPTPPPVIGNTLTTSVGTWSGTMATYTFQWKRGGANIGGATGSSYLLVAGDYATMITVTVTATNAAGSASATSAAVGPVTLAAPVNSVLPAITGSTVQGNVLTTTTGTWSGSPIYAYQWKRDGTTNVGTNASTYTTVSGDVGYTITVVVTATNAGGSANATSAAVGPVTAAVGGALSTPTLSSLTTATDTGASNTDSITSDSTPDINIDWGVDQPIENDVIEVRSNGVLVATHTVTALEEVMSIISLNTPLAEGTNSITVRHLRGADASNWSGALVVVIDATVPVLTSPSGTQTGPTTATLAVTTGEGNGTLYYVVTTSATPPTAAQIKLGQNNTGAAALYAGSQAVTTTGVKNASATGVLTTAPYFYAVQDDLAGNQSAISTASWTQAGTTINWDPIRKKSDVALSGSNLTASLAAHSIYANVFGTGSGKSSGKYYFEVTINAMPMDGQGFGFGDAAVTVGEIGGGQDTSVSWRFGTGNVMRAAQIKGTVYTAAPGDIVCCAVDFDAKRVWFRKKTGGTTSNWNNSGTADPATGTGGIDPTVGIAIPLTGPFWPMFTLELNTDNITANFGGSAYAMTPPAGFGNWS